MTTFDHILLCLNLSQSPLARNSSASLEKPCPERRHNDYVPIESQWDSGAFRRNWQAPRPDWKGHSNMPAYRQRWHALLWRLAAGNAAKVVPNPSVDRVCDGPLS